MINTLIDDEKINTDADASLKGIGLQKLRATERLLSAVLEERKAISCTIEHVDDVLEVEMGEEKTNYTTEQNKSYSTNFSMNSEEIKNSLRIFFDNWRGIVEDSESIRFVFYTNTNIMKEKKVGAIKDMKEKLPKKPLLQLLQEKNYKEAFPFVLPIFRQYYLEQHAKHEEDGEEDEISPYEKLFDSMTQEKWTKFFDLVEWNFGEADENRVRDEVDLKVKQLCVKFNVDIRFADLIVGQILNMIEAGTFEKDYLKRIVNVADIKVVFLQLAQKAEVTEKLDPMHAKWDEIKCNDIRDIGEKILNVCPEYDDELIEDLKEEYIDGKFEQKSYYEQKEVKAYNYRIYRVCQKLVKKVINTEGDILAEEQIDNTIDTLIIEAEKMLEDKSKTYKMPFQDCDMIRKTIILLFEECFLAFDERGVKNE